MNPVNFLALKVGAVALSVGVALGGWLGHLFYSPRLELAQANVKSLGEKIDEQNTAITQLQDDAKEREKRAKTAIAAAEAKRREAELSAAALLAESVPDGADPCQAASDLIRRELSK